MQYPRLERAQQRHRRTLFVPRGAREGERGPLTRKRGCDCSRDVAWEGVGDDQKPGWLACRQEGADNVHGFEHPDQEQLVNESRPLALGHESDHCRRGDLSTAADASARQ